MFADVVGPEAVRVQVITEFHRFKAAQVKISQRILKQRIVIRLEPDLPAFLQEGTVLHQLPRMGQPALFMLGVFRPGIAEMVTNAAEIR